MTQLTLNTTLRFAVSATTERGTAKNDVFRAKKKLLMTLWSRHCVNLFLSAVFLYYSGYVSCIYGTFELRLVLLSWTCQIVNTVCSLVAHRRIDIYWASSYIVTFTRIRYQFHKNNFEGFLQRCIHLDRYFYNLRTIT